MRRRNGRSTVSSADRFQVVLQVDAAALQLDSDDGQAVLEPGVRVSAETSRRLSCDASRVLMTHGADGSVLDVGRRRRIVPPAIRRALEHRDGGCRFPGCDLRYCDAHHIRHWADGGTTSVDNLILVCRRHHRALHEEGFSVRLTESGEPAFYRPDDTPLLPAPSLPRVAADAVGRLMAEHMEMGLEIQPWTATPAWFGERLDLDFALRALRRG